MPPRASGGQDGVRENTYLLFLSTTLLFSSSCLITTSGKYPPPHIT
jgi:hypothetical protein